MKKSLQIILPIVTMLCGALTTHAQVAIGTSTPVSQFTIQQQNEATDKNDTNDGLTLLDPSGEILLSISGKKSQGVYMQLPNPGNALILDKKNLSFDASISPRALLSCGISEGATAPNVVNDNTNGRTRNRIFDFFYNGAVGYGIGFHSGAAEFYKSSGGAWQFGYENGNDFIDFWTIGGNTNPYMLFGFGGMTLQTNTFGQSAPRSQFKGGVFTNTNMIAEGSMYSSAFNTTSDRRLKSNVTPIDAALEIVMNLKPVHYTKRSASNEGDMHDEFGFIAQDIHKILPEIVKGEETDTSYLSLDYNSFIAILAKAVQEQEAHTQTLEERIAALELQLQIVHSSNTTKNQTAGFSKYLIFTLSGILLFGFVVYQIKKQLT